MLVKDQQLNLNSFKRFYKKMTWTKSHRKLSETKIDLFYIGVYEDVKKKIKVVIRPSMVMMLSESFKNLTEDGKKPKTSYDGKLYEFGTTIEVKIDNIFLSKIEREVKDLIPKKTQIVSWK